ncbi:hypothetical protein BDZ91DRAFT_852722 [Kalaharituber pfeilii]|nr:hypothetical protein BDZ91DRAFT_852722 [Kalaharituber pfeilii]
MAYQSTAPTSYYSPSDFSYPAVSSAPPSSVPLYSPTPISPPQQTHFTASSSAYNPAASSNFSPSLPETVYPPPNYAPPAMSQVQAPPLPPDGSASQDPEKGAVPGLLPKTVPLQGGFVKKPKATVAVFGKTLPKSTFIVIITILTLILVLVLGLGIGLGVTGAKNKKSGSRLPSNGGNGGGSNSGIDWGNDGGDSGATEEDPNCHSCDCYKTFALLKKCLEIQHDMNMDISDNW